MLFDVPSPICAGRQRAAHQQLTAFSFAAGEVEAADESVGVFKLPGRPDDQAGVFRAPGNV